MRCLFGRPILIAAEMRAAEQRLIDAGTSVETLMERAGAAAAEAIWRFAGPLPALVLCGPGNNGGDGYVIARLLQERGVEVQVAYLGEARGEAARAARQRFGGPSTPLLEAQARPLLIDALFGTGLKRGLDEPVREMLLALAAQASVRAAIDLPSGVGSDGGEILSAVPDYDLTITFGAAKPSHYLQPAARHTGLIVLGDIGIEADSRLHLIGRPNLPEPGPDDHKYSRGYVALVTGEMPGASALAAAAALRSGAGYVRLIGDAPVAGVPSAVVQGGASESILSDSRVSAIAVGPGLGRGDDARELMDKAMAAAAPKIFDADALFLLGRNPIALDGHILTPHGGEFARLFGDLAGSKVDQARRAAEISGAVILYKGADTVVAAPDGRAAIAPAAPAWLASAGTGDVLTGIVAAMRARGMEPFEAASAAAWLHGRAAELAGPNLIADDLIAALPAALR